MTDVVKVGVWLPMTAEMMEDASVIQEAKKYPTFKRVKAGLYHGSRLFDSQNAWRIERSGGEHGKYWYAYRRRHHDADWEYVRVHTHNRETSLKLAILLVRNQIDAEMDQR
jgi:hypothetical protein